MTDDSQVDGSDTDPLNVPGDALQLTNLSPGACTSGWVGFTVRGGETPSKIQFHDSDFYWTISQ